jgi:hypothetical protein
MPRIKKETATTTTENTENKVAKRRELPQAFIEYRDSLNGGHNYSDNLIPALCTTISLCGLRPNLKLIGSCIYGFNDLSKINKLKIQVYLEDWLAENPRGKQDQSQLIENLKQEIAELNTQLEVRQSMIDSLLVANERLEELLVNLSAAPLADAFLGTAEPIPMPTPNHPNSIQLPLGEPTN